MNLSFGYEFNQKIEKDVLPNNLEKLSICKNYYNINKKNIKCYNITKLKIIFNNNPKTKIENLNNKIKKLEIINYKNKLDNLSNNIHILKCNNKTYKNLPNITKKIEL
jgi:hypothetical protein